MMFDFLNKKPFNFIFLGFSVILLLSFNSDAKPITPFEGTLSVSNYQIADKAFTVNLELLSRRDAQNVSVSVELFSEKGTVSRVDNVWQGSLKMDETIYIDTPLKLQADGLFRIGVIVYLSQGSAFQSKLFLIYVRLENNSLSTYKTDPTKKMKIQVDSSVLEKTSENETLIKAIKID